MLPGVRRASPTSSLLLDAQSLEEGRVLEELEELEGVTSPSLSSIIGGRVFWNGIVQGSH